MLYSVSCKQLALLIERHQHYINKDCEGWEHMCLQEDNLDLSNKNFEGVNLTGAILRFCDLRNCNFRLANLSGTKFINSSFDNSNLSEANLSHSELVNVSFRDAYLRDADFQCCKMLDGDCTNAYFCSANFDNSSCKCTNFTNANLYISSFINADLIGANFTNAVIDRRCLTYKWYNANLQKAINPPYIPMACPPSGAFIGWKMVAGEDLDYYVIKLQIPEEARRCSATTRKCRCDKALVLGAYKIGVNNLLEVNEGKFHSLVHSQISKPCTYEIGKMVYPDDFTEDRYCECSHGIHFFMDKYDAIHYHD